MYDLTGLKVEGSAEIWNTEDGSILYVVMSNENEEQIHALMRMIQEHATLQRYYWISLLDETYITYLKPKVYDAFKIEIVAVGSNKQLKKILNDFNEYKNNIETAKRMLIS